MMQVEVGVVIALAFIIINILTGNYIIAAMAVFAITGVLLTALGCGAKAIMNWDFGIAEAMATVVVIGCGNHLLVCQLA